MAQKPKSAQMDLQSQIASILSRHYEKETRKLKIFFRSEAQKQALKRISSKEVSHLGLRGRDINDANIDYILQFQWSNVRHLEIGTALRQMRIQQNYLKRNQKINRISVAGALGFDLWQSFSYSGQLKLTKQACQIIFKRNFSQLRKLKIIDAFIDRPSLSSLVGQRYEHLITLRLVYNQSIGCDGAKYLTKAHMPQLKKLMFEGCSIQSEGAKILNKGYWPQLQLLTINDNSIQYEGYLQLLKGGWSKMKKFRSGNGYEQAYNLVMEPISYMSLVLFSANDVDLLMKIVSYVNQDLMETNNLIMGHRFDCHFAQQQQQRKSDQDSDRYDLDL